MTKDEQARCHGEYERFQILERIIASAAHIGGREETEDVLGRLGELPELRGRLAWCGGIDRTGRQLTEVQYASSGGMCLSSESLKMPFLKTSLESLAPMLATQGHRITGIFQLSVVRLMDGSESDLGSLLNRVTSQAVPLGRASGDMRNPNPRLPVWLSQDPCNSIRLSSSIAA